VFVQRIEKIVANLSSSSSTSSPSPFFLFWAPHAPHDPYQVPQSYLDKPIFASITQPERQYYAAMTNLLDDNVGRVIALLKSNGLWNNTLIVFSSDNGGPEGDGYGGNNFPLRGGKSSNWEGGVRVNGLVTGGLVPPSKRGTKAEGLIAVEDWYTTFCALAGVSPEDPLAAAAGLPPPDGLNQWPYLSGVNETSPRQYVIMGSSDSSNAEGNAIVTGVLRSDGYKLLLGKLANNWWTGPVYPNSTTYPTGSHDCGQGCLFNVFTDPSEYSDIAADHPDIVAALTKVAKEQEATAYNPQRGTDDGEACQKAFAVHKGFWGP
jgi:arylsulfatase I/J